MQRNLKNNRRKQAGFTLIELLLVLMILVVLGSMAVSMFSGTQDRALRDAAKGQVGILKNQAELYKHHMKTYPGVLDDLVKRPGSSDTSGDWEGPYIDGGEVPQDPWGRPYKFVTPGKHNPETFDVYSLGPDGQDGTEDDIGNWKSS
jgi:general secretion pathway protein G